MKKKIDVIFYYIFVSVFPPLLLDPPRQQPKIPASRGSWILFCQLISITNFGPLMFHHRHDSLSNSAKVRLIKGTTTYFTIPLK